jgi:hypothetical protein
VVLRTLPAAGGAVSVVAPSPVPEQKFGELLIEERAITREQLEDALRVQSALRHYLPVGQVLLNRGRLSRGLLTTLLRRHRKSARLGELLVRSGQITTDQLQTALDQQTQTGQALGHTLMALGFVSEETMRGALCAQVHVNFFDFDLIKLDPSLARLVNEKYASRHRVVPLFRAGSMLVVGVDDPTDTSVVEDLQLLLGMRVEMVTSTTNKIQRAISRLYGEAARDGGDPCLYRNVLIGIVRDQEVADAAAKALGVKILPPYWQSR